MPSFVAPGTRRELGHAETLDLLVDIVGPIAAVHGRPDGRVAIETIQDVTATQIEAARDLLESRTDTEATLRRQARAALAANRDYLARSSTTAAQDKAQLRAITQQVNALIRLAVSEV